jgi:hypothetical protein
VNTEYIMTRRVFYSFHYANDVWRTSQVRNIGVVEGNSPCSDNDWETVTRGGAAAIARWIDRQFEGRTCAIVLVGAQTAGRPWINYEIDKAWSDGLGLFGIRIHRLLHSDQRPSVAGANPFEQLPAGNGRALSNSVRLYDPPGVDSRGVYGYIQTHLDDWVEAAIAQGR